MPGANAAEQRVVDAQSLEDGSPQQRLDIALDHAAIREDKSKSSALQRRCILDPEHHLRMLPQGLDPPQRKAGPRQLPVIEQLISGQELPRLDIFPWARRGQWWHWRRDRVTSCALCHSAAYVRGVAKSPGIVCVTQVVRMVLLGDATILEINANAA